MRNPKWILSIITCLLLSSCGGPVVFDRYQTIDGRHWEKDKEYYFTVEIDDITTPYNLTFEVRNNNLYPFQNLWIFWGEEQPSQTILKDTTECMLADDYGKWLGQGISLYQSSFPLRTEYRFPETGTYTFSFRQGMRNDELPGIQEIGLKVIKSE